MDDRPVLRRPERDAELRRVGWLVEPMLSPEQVEALRAAYAAIVPDGESGVALDFIRDDRELVRRLDAAAREVLEPVVDEAFVDHRPVLISNVVKHPGPDSAFYLHRDIAVNDARVNRCFTLWIPLVDVGPANGGLGVIPASHDLPLGEQGFEATVLADPFRPVLDQLVETVELAAGEALVYDARILHGSAPNLSDAPRPAIGCTLGRRSEPLTHVVPTGRRGRRLYQIDRDFFVDHHPARVAEEGMPERYPLLETFEDVHELTAATLQGVLGLDQRPEPVIVLADDDLAVDGPPGPLRARPLPLGLPPHDLALEPDELTPLATTLGEWNVVHQRGDCRGRSLVERGRRVQAPPQAVTAAAGLLRGPRTRAAAILVLGRRTRVTLDVPARRGTRTELVVLECPQVRSGVRAGELAANFDLDQAIDLPPGARITLWNDGYGPTIVLLRRAIGRATG